MKQNVSQSAILRQVDALVTRQKGQPSLLEVGYSHIGIDDGWQACGKGVNGSFHDANGRPIIDLERFPDMRAMNIQSHSRVSRWVSLAVVCGSVCEWLCVRALMKFV